MSVSKAQQKAVAKYEARVYDKTLIRLPKGRLDAIKVHAAARGESVNGFIGRAITETMNRDNGGGTPTEAAHNPTDAFSGGGATPILSGAKTPSEAAKNTVQGG